MQLITVWTLKPWALNISKFYIFIMIIQWELLTQTKGLVFSVAKKANSSVCMND